MILATENIKNRHKTLVGMFRWYHVTERARTKSYATLSYITKLAESSRNATKFMKFAVGDICQEAMVVAVLS